MRNLVLSTQGLNKVQTCPRLYWYSQVLRKTPVDKPKYFIEGEYLHFVLDQYYSQKLAQSEVNIHEVIRASRDKATEMNGLTIEECETLLNLAQEYFNFHAGDEWTIEASEKPFAKVLWEDERLDLRIIVKGKADLLALTRQSIPIIVDHKKVSQNRQPFSRDNQILSYCWAFDRRDFIINQLGTQKTLPPKDKFKRHYFNVYSHQIDEWIEETIYNAFEIVKYHENSIWPGRIHSCQNQGRACTFYDVCQSEKTNWEYKLGEGSNFITADEHDIMGEEE